MGYTTKFTGKLDITPRLTMEHYAEYSEMVDRIWDACKENRPEGAPDSYLQWEVTKDGYHLRWDGNEKFYDYEKWLRWVANQWFAPRGYTLSGSLRWKGEEGDDRGTLTVSTDGVVEAEKDLTPAQKVEAERQRVAALERENEALRARLVSLEVTP